MTYEQLLEQCVEQDERYVVVTAENRAAIRNLPARIGDRFIDVGIAEQTMVGMCAGLALRGRIPVAHALASFLTMRAFEFIRTDVGIARLPVKLVGGVPGFLSEANGPTHQAIEDIAIMRGIPNMGVFCPADEVELLQGLPAILEHPDPFYIRYNAMKPVVEHSTSFEIGVAERLNEGEDITILTYGFLLREAMSACRILEEQGISVRVVNMRTLKPVDETAILRAVEDTSLVVTLEDHFQTGGLYSIVAETLLKNQMRGNVLPLALNEQWFTPGLLNDVLRMHGFTGEAIAETVLRRFETPAHVRAYI